MGKNAEALCHRGCRLEGSFFHIIWSCPRIQEYWSAIIQCLTAVYGNERPLTPKWCLLNVWEPTDLSRADQIGVTLALMIAKRNAMLLWGADSIPTLRDWKRDMDWCMVAKKAVYNRGCRQKWGKVRNTWNMF